MSENSHPAEPRPSTIGRYRIEEEIGFGAMGAVYKAFDPLIKRTLAIKTIRLDIPRQTPQYRSFIERFYHEARISGTLSHPNIVTLFDIGEEGGSPFLAMEFIEGETIGALIERGERFKPEKVIGLVSQVASALDYAHGKGIIHRDIKPSNLMLFDGDKIKVTDFGIAKLADAEMTQSGTLLGTPSYMSPEQAMGDKLDGRSDIFSLGVCAFEMLSGEQPFPGNNVTSILYKLVHVDPIEPANLEMHGLVPGKWHEVFGKVLAKKPDDRYQSGAQFVHDLEYCLGSWFGSLEDTLIAAPASPPPDPERTTTIKRAVPDAVPESTAPLPIPDLGLSPPPPAAGEEPTVLLNPPPGPRTAAPAAAAASAGEAESATVVFKSAPPRPAAAAKTNPPAPAEAESPVTVMLPSPPPIPVKTGDSATVLMRAGGEEPTVIMAPPPAAPPAATRRTPEAAPVAEPTQPMARPPLPTRAAAAKPAPPAPAPPPPVDNATVLAATLRPTPARPGLSPKAVLAGAAALLVLAVAAIGLVLLRREPAAPVAPASTLAPQASAAPTPAPPVEIAGTLHVESDPPGAAVSVNGETHGATPLDLGNLPVGSYEVKLELKGYQAKTQTVEVREDALRADVKVALAKAAPATGSADFTSTPPGATVTVDGAKIGQTPLTGISLRAGARQVAVSEDGYDSWTGTLQIQPGQRSKIDARLRALVRETPPPAPVEVVDTTRVYPNTPTEVDTPARRISGTTVSYPEAAPRLRSGDSVSVGVSFVVNEGGEVTDLRVVQSGGKILDEAVTAGVRSWKYAPAVKKGTKVKVQINFKQTFRAG